MCSRQEDSCENIPNLIKSIKVSESDLCRKCQKSTAEVVLRGKDLYCSPCFVLYFVHKFRSTIGKSKEIKHEDKVLVGFSGGPSSTALLHLIQDGLKEESTKRLRFEPSILFIDESCLSSSPKADCNAIWEAAQAFKFPCYQTCIEEILKPESSSIYISSKEDEGSFSPGSHYSSRNTSQLDELKNLISSRLRSSTSKEDMVSHLRDELIRRCAKQLGFRKVFLGNNGTELAVKILSDIALGRGSQLSEHTGFKSCNFGVEVFRPMRELLQDEIEHYITFLNVLVPSEERHPPTNSGIVSCTRDFVFELQKEFVSTVPTIFKTGGKLVNGNLGNVVSSSPNSEVGEIVPSAVPRDQECRFCLMCGLPKDDSSVAVNAVQAIKVSKLLSEQPPSSGDESLSQPLSRIPVGCGEPQSVNLKEEEIYRFFCCGCRNLVQEIGSFEFLPARVKEALKLERSKE